MVWRVGVLSQLSQYLQSYGLCASLSLVVWCNLVCDADHWRVIKVLSFISQFSAPHKDSRSPTPTQPPPKLVALHDPHLKSNSNKGFPNTQPPQPQSTAIHNEPSAIATTPSPVSSAAANDEHANSSPPVPVTNSNSSSPPGTPRRNSRPLSMVQTYQPPLMDVNEETLPELQPIFNFLNSHTNKLYQEGYFLKLDDQDISALPALDPAPALKRTSELTVLQRASQTQIEHGPSASHSWSAQSCRYGTLPSWTQREKTAKCCRNS